MDNLHLAWAELLLRGFCAAGVSELVLSPGSRSTPLALAAAKVPELRVHVVIDERQAGFFALGQARVSGRPSVLVCTSGTAAGHYLPALLEAREANLPVIVLSADRPWEAQHVASAQTTDQRQLFGAAVLAAFDLPCPEPGPASHAALARTAVQAVSVALGARRGAVHVNAPFRKPLEPQPGEAPSLACAPARWLSTERTLSASARAWLAEEFFRGAERVVFIAGPSLRQERPAPQARWSALLEASSALAIAESTSGLAGTPLVLRHPSALLPVLAQADRIVQLGLPPVSTALQSWLASTGSPRVVVAEERWADPWSNAAAIVPISVEQALVEMSELLGARTDSSFGHRARELDAQLTREQEHWLEAQSFAEPQVAAQLSQRLGGAHLFVGNSLPPRDLDTFGRLSAVRVLHQRGVAGIDGLIAGAVGSASLVTGPLVLYLGDVSFLHDVGALALLRQLRTPLVVVAVNNDGGRIFEELPLGAQPELGGWVERHFVTPHGQSLVDIAKGFGVRARQVADARGFERELDQALQHDGSSVIEVVVDAALGKAQRRAWRERAAAVVAAAMEHR